MNLDLILRVGTKLVAPFILLFAFYVQFHGDYGPGGGFQAGVIAAAMVILVSIMFGMSAAKRIAPKGMVEAMMPLGVMIFIGVGVYSLFMGHNFLDYSALMDGGPKAHERGILLVETGVFITVAGTMVAIFYAVIERARR